MNVSRRTAWGAIALFLSVLGVPAQLGAQVPWESPMMLAPGSPPGLGLLFVDFGLAPNDGMGGLLTWRNQSAPGGFGMRLAATRGGTEGDVQISGGMDVSVPMFTRSATFPLDVIWTSGAGAAWGDYLQIAVPAGFAVGRTLSGPAIWFNPYFSTRVVFEAFVGEDRPEDFDLALAADLGFDIAFDSGRDLVFRVAASLGDRHALIAGIHTTLGR